MSVTFLMCVDWYRASGDFGFNLVHKLKICRNLLAVLLKAFVIVPPKV